MKITKKTEVNAVEFWSQFEGKTKNECWETKQHLTKGGYGRVWIYPKMVYAHRVAWELTNGKIPPGMVICHKCDNPPCCNPDHLFLGTHLDNMADAKNKGRNSHGPVMYGSHHPLSKLTEKDVQDIIKDYVPTPRKKSDNNIPALAKRYGVARSLIHRIIKGKSWPHISTNPATEQQDVILEAP